MNEVTINILITLFVLWLGLGFSVMLSGSLDKLNEIYNILHFIWAVYTTSLVAVVSILTLIYIWA